MLLDIILPLVSGGALLAIGGEALVSGGAGTARRLALPSAAIGVLVLGFGTSMPEFFTSIAAARLGSPDIALGNVLGSNTANVLLILGLVALLAPMAILRDRFRFDLWVAVAAAVMLGLAMIGTGLNEILGIFLLMCLGVYALILLVSPRPADEEATPGAVAPILWMSLGLTALGLGAAIFGASLFVEGAVSAARTLGMTEAAIGATIVAVGTSLPELATSLMAARRGQAGLAIGNIVGSNIFNIFGVLGATLLVAPIEFQPEALWRDMPAMLVATLALGLAILGAGRLTRGAGVAMLALYAGYLALMAA